jgi:hypothetical protein
LLIRILFLAASLPSYCWASNFQHCDTFILEPTEMLEEENWIHASTISLMGQITDDCFLYGSNLILRANFEDDLWAAGVQVEFDGHAEDRVRIAALQMLKVHGHLRDGLSAYAKTIHIQPGTHISQASHLAGENVLIEGTFSNKLWIAATKVTLKGEILGDLRIIAEDLVILPGSRISGDIYYTMASELVIGKGVTFSGEKHRVTLDDYFLGSADWLSRIWPALHLIFFLNALLIGVLFVLASPRLIGQSVRSCRNTPFRSLFIGMLLFFILPGIIQLLIFIQFGIPAAAFLLTIYILGLYLGKLVIAFSIGGMILRLQGRQKLPRVLFSLLTGTAILYFVMALPFFGFVVWLAVGSYGLGGMIHGQVDTQWTMIRRRRGAASEKSGPEES